LIGDIPLTYQTYTFSNTSALNIPDESTIYSNLTVSGLSGAIADVNVTLNITQTYNSHLDVFLISPTGTRVTLFRGVGRLNNWSLDLSFPATSTVSNDTLNGGRGNDTMRGGGGNDTYVVDSTGDVIIENLNEGTDTVQSSISYTLGANLENLTLTGTDAINGTGNSGNNIITGNSGNNTLNGGSGVDTLLGGNGNDILIGGTGNDTLTGGAGSDRFTFNSRSEGIDRITDFSVVDDTIAVSAAGFGGGLVVGSAIAASQFRLGSAATTSSDRFLYDKSTGALFFDQDGTGAIAKTQFATLNTGLALTNADIFVTA
jgi:Ca2+-binding RTX toxin-like protein